MLFLAVIALASTFSTPASASYLLSPAYSILPVSSKPTYIEIANGQGCILHVEWKAEQAPSGGPLKVTMSQANPICDLNAATVGGVAYNRWPIIPTGDVAAGYVQVLYGIIVPDGAAGQAQGDDICGMVNVQLDGYEGWWNVNTLTNLTAKDKNPEHFFKPGWESGILTGESYHCTSFKSSTLLAPYQLASDTAQLPNPYLVSNLKLKGKAVPLDIATYTFSLAPTPVTSSPMVAATHRA